MIDSVLLERTMLLRSLMLAASLFGASAVYTGPVASSDLTPAQEAEVARSYAKHVRDRCFGPLKPSGNPKGEGDRLKRLVLCNIAVDLHPTDTELKKRREVVKQVWDKYEADCKAAKTCD
jgi:hypothetical protein